MFDFFADLFDVFFGSDPVDAGAGHSGPVHFGSTVEFPSGTKIEDPFQDALGYVYESRLDYTNGSNKHVLGD